ncbi:MAG TPA: response regulator transcription factor [Anaerolineaceae bacterium]|nr:response regulator transcription factor [Anaerolineaceae bacterium]
MTALNVLLVEDNAALRRAMKAGLEKTGQVRVVEECASGEEALALFLDLSSGLLAVLMDVALAGALNGIQAAVCLRREYPRLPVVFYTIQDDDAYYRDFLRSGILSHYAYVRKSNYLLPESVLPLLRDAAAGRSFIDPEIESRVQEVRHKDANDPLVLLEPNEQAVVALLAQGLTNEQIAARLGYRDARAVSRTNGQIYTAWNLDNSTTDEKVARTRAVLIYHRRQLLVWDENGIPCATDSLGRWTPIGT